jgi:superfamily II DNA/RNA helicase
MEATIRKLLEQYLNNGPRQVIFASATVTKQMKALAQDFFGPGTDPSHDF